MSRRQVIGFVVVLALIGAGLLVRRQGTDPHAQEPDLTALRSTAALSPCPSGLSPELPDLRLACLGGGDPVALRSSPLGTPSLVNIWATWCGPCVREVPVLVAFAHKAAGKVGVVGVDTEDKASDALTFAAQNGMRYPSVSDDDGKVLRRYGGGPPITLFVDAAGKVVFTRRGELKSAAELAALVAEHLGVTV